MEYPKLIPRKVLFGNPVKANPQISPDGSRLAHLAPLNDVMNVWVKTIGAEDERVVTHDNNRGIYRYFWAEDNKHIMYLQDVEGNENWRLFAVNLKTGEIRELTPFDDVQVQIVGRDKHFPNDLLIGMNKENPEVRDVYHLDIPSGELTLVARNPGNVTDWLADSDLSVRCAMATTPKGGFDLLIRERGKEKWNTLLTWELEDSINSYPECFTKDGEALYCIDSRDANAGRLVKIELATGTVEIIAEDQRYDVSRVMIHPDTYEVQAVAFHKARLEWIVLDESIEDDFKSIAKLDHGDYAVYDRDNADEIWLVGFTKDDGPVSYFAYDRMEKRGTFLFDHKPDLKNFTLASMEPISFTSRDGLTIHGYVTFPPGREKEDLPMVLTVHGGPYLRDVWGYDAVAQWIANRGYVCLQVNFRGSTGYGKDFINAADKEWGGKMHDDLEDAVRWAVKQGFANPDKVAIYGGSYGGFAALVGATSSPDLFCCAIDICGFSNLITWIKSIPPYWSPFLALLYKRLGNPDTEEEFLKSRSPLFNVDQIKIPMLIGQGANDPRVPRAESEQIVEALQERGIDYEYLLFPDEGHGFMKPENRLRFYATAEKFLVKHLGGRFEELDQRADR